MDSGSGSVLLAHASDGVARAVEELQFTLGEGPAVVARARHEPVLVGDLTAPPDQHEPWPIFRAEAAALGVRALFAFPIRVGTVGLGSLDLYRRTPGDLRADQVQRATDTCLAMGNSLVDPGLEGFDANGRDYPMTVHRAAGMVMVQLGSSIDDALVRLRATAYLESVSVTTIAGSVLDGRRRFVKEET